MSSQKHYIIRVGDGDNFKNSKNDVWGVKKNFEGTVKKMNEDDILWFLKSKSSGGNFIGMAKFIDFYDREIEEQDLICLNTYSNEEQNWQGEEKWSIQIHYKELYDTDMANITAIIQCASSIMAYDTFKDKEGIPNLIEHYNMFKKYASPINNSRKL